MVGLGTLVNSGAILAGAGAGLLLRRGLAGKNGRKASCGCGTVYHCIGVQMAFKK